MELSERCVTRLEYYLLADATAFRLSLRLLRRLGYRISLDRRRALRAFPSMDKILWNARDRRLASSDPRKVSIAGYELVHQAMHALISRRYGWDYERRPKLTLLAESLAGATEHYYEFASLANSGWKGKTPFLKSLERNAKILKRPFLRAYQAGVNDPFAAFKRFASEEYRIARIMIGLATSSGEVNYKKLARSFENSESYLLLRDKDFGSFVAFALAKCGKESSPEDEASTRECLSLLKHSQSMVEFLERMGVREFISSGTGVSPRRRAGART